MSNTAIPADDPQLTIQTATLWSSGDNNVFAGSGGPEAFDPFTYQFADIVSSAGLDATPFQDAVWDIQAGDILTFVIAIQNRGQIGQAFDTIVRDYMPANFTYPDYGTNLTVTDGDGNPLDFTGDLFGTGLVLQDPIAPYDPDSGANIDLISFDLQANVNLAVPAAQLTALARITSYARSEGGPNLSAEADPATLAATTQVNTAGFTVVTTPDQPVTTLLPNQTASYDVTVTLSLGQTSALTIQEILPHLGNSWLQLVSVQILSVGAGLYADGSATVQPDGSINFGNVIAVPNADGLADAVTDSIKLRITVRGGGTAAGQGTLQVVVSSADPNHPGQPTSAIDPETVPLAAPDVPPTIAGLSANQTATNSAITMPFAKLALADPDPGQIQTLTIHLSDPLMGSLSAGGGTYNAASGTYTITGAVASVQAAARALTFTAGSGRTGTETFGLTIDDGDGGVATASAGITLTAAQPAAARIQHFPLAPSKYILTQTNAGTQTVDQVETYAGPVDYLQYQFIFDGTTPLAISAQTPNIFIKSVAGSAAVQLLSGQNVVDAGSGSNFLSSGTGQDTFYLDARQLVPTWDTIVGFHTGDIATIFGFQQGVSQYHWDESAGAAGYTGRTLRLDISGSGQTQESLTFAGKFAADTATYAITEGNLGGTTPYMAIFAL